MAYIVFQCRPHSRWSRLRKTGTKYSFVMWNSSMPVASSREPIDFSASRPPRENISYTGIVYCSMGGRVAASSTFDFVRKTPAGGGGTKNDVDVTSNRRSASDSTF